MKPAHTKRVDANPMTKLLVTGEWNEKDYEDALNLWAELASPQTGVRYGPTTDMSKAAIQLAKLGKRTLSLLPWGDGNLRKAKKTCQIAYPPF